MEIIDVIETPPFDSTPLTLLIGTFDGLHKGHQFILQTAKEHINLTKETLAVMSFSKQPEWDIEQNLQFRKKITPETEKIQLLKQYGVEKYYRIKISENNVKMTEEFFLQYLSSLNIKRLIIGDGFRIGNTRYMEELIQLCARLEINVKVVPIVKANGVKISSTTTSEFIKRGLMESVHSLLGRPFTITGTVVHGEKMGRKLGFPTINLGDIDSYVAPKAGVYFGVVGIYMNSVITEYRNVLISAGYRPTVNGQGYLIEAHILNFTGDLYGKTVSLSFLHYMREEINFTDLDSLKKQMEKDKMDAGKLIGSQD